MQDKSMKEKIGNSFWLIFFWFFQLFGLSVFIALIPGLLGLVGEIINGINKYVDRFFDLSWGIKIPVYLFLGLCLKLWLANKYPEKWGQKEWK